MIESIFYRPYVIINLTGNTIDYSGASSAITSGIYISSGFTFNINDFDKHIINRIDIIDNVVNYVNYMNKYMLNILIVNSGETIINSGVTQLGEYCVKISFDNYADYFIMSVSNSAITNTTTTTTTTTQQIDTGITYSGVDIKLPVIYYNSGTSWIGSGITVPHNVFLHLIHDNFSYINTLDNSIISNNNFYVPYLLDNGFNLISTDIRNILDNFSYGISVVDYFENVTTTTTTTFVETLINISSGWTLDSLKYLFISGATDCFDGNVPLSSITFLLFKSGSNIPLTGITSSGRYNIYISFTDNSGNIIINYISNIIVDDEPPIISYKPYVYNLTGGTSGITSGFTFNIFYKDSINRLDIIDNLVNYVYDSVDNNINKYMLNILIFNSSGGTITNITQTGEYLIKILISDSSGNETINWLIMNVVHDINMHSLVNYILPNNYISGITISSGFTFSGVDIKPPIIYYNSGTSWLGSGITVPYNVFLNLVHDGFLIVYSEIVSLSGESIVPYYREASIGNNKIVVTDVRNIFDIHNAGISIVDVPEENEDIIPIIQPVITQVTLTGWTLNDLKYLFISGITNCFDGNIPLSSITFNLFRGSFIPLTGITSSGVYNIYISVTDNSGNNIINYISNIVVDDEPPIIVYKPYVISSGLTGNTIDYSGASSAITSGIYISSGFTLNLGGFDGNIINRLDIINNIVNYAYDIIDIDINKYMINVLICGSHNSDGPIIYNSVNQPGDYCVQLSLLDSSGNKIIYYFIMKVIYDVSVYSEGYWQDNKVWVDFVLWLDHPIVPER